MTSPPLPPNRWLRDSIKPRPGYVPPPSEWLKERPISLSEAIRDELFALKAETGMSWLDISALGDMDRDTLRHALKGYRRRSGPWRGLTTGTLERAVAAFGLTFVEFAQRVQDRLAANQQ